MTAPLAAGAAPAAARPTPPARLLLLTDRRLSPRPLVDTVRAAVDGGARAVVLREKDLPAAERVRLADGLRAVLPDDALLVLAGTSVPGDALHLAAADAVPDPRPALLGRSCHDAAELAAAAGCDWVTLSPVFATATKPGYGPALRPAGLAALLGPGAPPAYALGGVDGPAAARACRQAGAYGVAVLGAVMRAPDPGRRRRRSRRRARGGPVTPPVALTIAGSDSGGGAGVQADLKAFAALGVFGTSALTALTAQSTTGVSGVLPVPGEFVVAQVEAVLADLPVAAVKTGMLGTLEVVRAVAGLAERLPQLVVDPVMVASSGDRLLAAEAERAYVELLLPVATVLTPNLLEAQALLGAAIGTLEEQRAAARELGALGPRVVVVKGGHATADSAGEAVDVVWDGTSLWELRAPRLPTGNTHGTGCTFAAATAAGLARGLPVAEALARAKAYVGRALAGGATWRLGAGHGPLDHLLWSERGAPAD